MFTLPRLTYSYDALEPYIDARTMEIHYTKHHQAYIDNLNIALQNYPDLQHKKLTDLLLNLEQLPEAIISTVQNNAGGDYNHTLFWQMMISGGKDLGRGDLLFGIEKHFGSLHQFKLQFETAAKTRFGSGWAWLVLDIKTGDLEVLSTPNQNSPISMGKSVILGLDVWEHAYYLHYQNRRADYIAAWWNVVDWGFVQDNYSEILKTL